MNHSSSWILPKLHGSLICQKCGTSIKKKDRMVQCYICHKTICPECNSYGFCKSCYEKLSYYDANQIRTLHLESDNISTQININIKLREFFFIGIIYLGFIVHFYLGIALVGVFLANICARLWFIYKTKKCDLINRRKKFAQILSAYSFSNISILQDHSSKKKMPKTIRVEKKYCVYCGTKNKKPSFYCSFCGCDLVPSYTEFIHS